MKPIDPFLPKSTTPETVKRDIRPSHPQATSFDTMAQSFTESFGADNGAPSSPIEDEPDSYPSPTPTIASTSSRYSRTSSRRSSAKHSGIDDAMDWTPTRRTFGPPQEILPPVWEQPPQPPQQPQLASHSIFAKPDPNPFRHKVPVMPNKRGNVWANFPTNKFSLDKKNVFVSERGASGSLAAQEALKQPPRNVQRDAEFFKAPQLKYDSYTAPKQTGLESQFDSLFSLDK